MLNNQFKNNIAPWQENGRWYHALVESNGTLSRITQCDLEGCVINTSYFILPKGYHCADVKCINVELVSGKTVTQWTLSSQSGKPAINIPSPANFTLYEIYFFAYAKNTVSAQMLMNE